MSNQQTTDYDNPMHCGLAADNPTWYNRKKLYSEIVANPHNRNMPPTAAPGGRAVVVNTLDPTCPGREALRELSEWARREGVAIGCSTCFQGSIVGACTLDDKGRPPHR